VTPPEKDLGPPQEAAGAPIQKTGTPQELTPVDHHIRQDVDATPGISSLHCAKETCRRLCHDRGIGPALGLERSNQDRLGSA
jgi:hypothetical protein